MLAFLKSFFSPSQNTVMVRHLTHPQQLQTGDIIKFRFTENPDISGKEFEVSTVNSYMYGDIGYSECVLKGRDNSLIYLMAEDEDGEEYLAISKKIEKAELLQVIPSQDLDAIKNNGLGTKISCAHNTLAHMKNWISSSYQVVDADIKGSFVKGDIRFSGEDAAQKQEHFTSYLLESASDDDLALEIEIYSTGEIEACATLYLDFDDIEEMWPATTV